MQKNWLSICIVVGINSFLTLFNGQYALNPKFLVIKKKPWRKPTKLVKAPKGTTIRAKA
jgi:transposase